MRLAGPGRAGRVEIIISAASCQPLHYVEQNKRQIGNTAIHKGTVLHQSCVSLVEKVHIYYNEVTFTAAATRHALT